MKLFPSSVETWNTVFQAISVILIAGTVLAGAGAIITNRIMNRRQSKELAAANAEAAKASKGVADANLEIAKAKEGTAQAVRDTAKANEEIAQLTKDAEVAKTERAEADKQIAIAKADAARAREGTVRATVEVNRLQVVVANAEQKRAEAERALVEVQERIKPRHLTADQSAQLTLFLQANPKGEVSIHFPGDDAEASGFARELAEAIAKGGWKININTDVGVQLRRGVFLAAHSREKEPPNGGFLEGGLLSSGVKVLSGFDPKFVREGELVLVIGGKPEP
jgi:hypothetical protein